MRVLCVTDDPGQGGTAINTTRTAILLARRGFETWHAVPPGHDPDAAARRAAAGVRDLITEFDPTHGFERSLFDHTGYAALLDACRPDLALFGDSAANSHLAAKLLSMERGLPFVNVVNLVDGEKAERFAERAGLVRATHLAAEALVTVSEENLLTLRRLFGLPGDRGQVIHNACPSAFFQAPDPSVRGWLRARHGIPDDAILCFTAARYEERKGHRHLLRAVAALRDSDIFGRLRFVCAGPDPTGFARGLAIEIAQAGLGASVTLLGPVDNLPDWLAASDIFILPSEAEGMPLVVSEAMARRLPVVATAVGGVVEQLGDAGVVVPDPRARPEDAVAELGEAIRRLVAHPDARRSMGNALHARARSLFCEERAADRYANLLRQCTAQPRGTVFSIPAPRSGRKPARIFLDFTETASVASFLRDGWGPCEDWGAWTVGPQAVVVADLDEATARRSPWLAVCCAGYVRPGWPALDMVVEAGGVPLGAIRFEGEPTWQTHAWPLPPGTGGPVRLTLRIDRPRAPAVMEGAPDTRPLGLQVAWIAVGTPADLPLTAFAAVRRALPAPLTDAGTDAFTDWLAKERGTFASRWEIGVLESFLIDRALTDRSPANLAALITGRPLDLVNAPLDAHRLPNPFSLPFTKLMASVHDRREDLKSAFDLGTRKGFSRYVAWYFLIGVFEHGLEETVSERQRLWLERPPASPGPGEHADTNGLALLLWLWRADLQTAFPFDRAEGRAAMARWLETSARSEGIPLVRWLEARTRAATPLRP